MMLQRPYIRAVASGVLSSAILTSAQIVSTSLPVVDLGYELYRASGFNESRAYYNFSNIRYAAPPVGDLRFKAPAPPVTNRSVINDGSVGRVCPQARAAWNAVALEFLGQYLTTGVIPNISYTNIPNSNIPSDSPRDTRETEDCLFLDVIVPQKVFESKSNGAGAPVLVWIYGGGYTAGSKETEGSPSGLLQRSITNCSDGVIYVAMNYRLGALGWLSGPTFQENGTANAALHDQRFALQWVQDNIHLFGGDKNRVTVLGQSAGGGSVLHQVTAFGGQAKAPFQQAIAQSPAWLPVPSPYYQEKTFQTFLKAANVSDLEEARQLSSEQVIAANALQVWESPWALASFGPTIDGDFVTGDPKSLLNHGQFDKSVKLMAAHNTNESLFSTPPIHTDSELDAFVRSTLPYTSQDVVDHITATLYPPVYNGPDALYKNPFERLALILAEGSTACNANALLSARNDTHGYLFAVSPGLHGQDVPYTYYDPGAASASGDPSLPFNETVAFVIQDYITSFAATGVPASAADGLPSVPEYGEAGGVVALTLGGIGVTTDPAANARCKWWDLNLLS